MNNVKGSKMGWTVGDETWAVAALTYGTAYENTVDVRHGINQVEDTPGKDAKDKASAKETAAAKESVAAKESAAVKPTKAKRR